VHNILEKVGAERRSAAIASLRRTGLLGKRDTTSAIRPLV
jgi:hypothetical protein